VNLPERRSFPLRAALLAAFLLLGLLPAAALSWLSFSKARDAMTVEITSSLEAQAQTIQTDIDAMMSERFENAVVWSHSELMQDLRLGDVDKRVSNNLRDLQGAYADVYRALDCVDELGLVLASSDPRDIGRRRQDFADAQRSVEAQLAGGRVSLYLPGPQKLDDPQPLVIATEIPLTFASGSLPHARLLLDFDAASLDRVLDAASSNRRVAVVVDAQGRWVAASRALRVLGQPDGRTPADGALLAEAALTRVSTVPRWLRKPAMVGRGHSHATTRFGGLGWTTLVFEPEDEALAPVARMATIFEVLLLAVLLATVLTASWIASAIARPIAALTDSARRYRREGRLSGAEPQGSRIVEIDVLGRAYREMIRSVEQSRRELVQGAKMAMLGELAAVLAHEVRTPLGILRSSAQILLRNPALGPEERELVAFIESETERLNRLVSAMLDMARPPQPRFAGCDLHALLQRCAQMHDLRRGAAGERFPVALDLQASDPQVRCDPEQLMQVFFNLLNNASEAAGPEGRVELATRDGGDGIEVRCSDDGRGISPELAERLFEPFVSGREGGVGLGLAVARQIVVAHGGEIGAGRSRWGGAAMTVRLRRRCEFDVVEATT
jgi:signal transduction histidine kinase